MSVSNHGPGISRLSESLTNVSKNTSLILQKLHTFEHRLSVIGTVILSLFPRETSLITVYDVQIDGYISDIRDETVLPSTAKRNVDATLIESKPPFTFLPSSCLFSL